MSDLISRQAAIDAIQNEVEPFVIVEPGTTCVIGAGVKDEDVIRVIEQLPSAQPEIIRCKDCKHRPFDSEDAKGFEIEFPDEKCPCQCEDGWYNWRPNDEWFCANAERRTDG